MLMLVLVLAPVLLYPDSDWQHLKGVIVLAYDGIARGIEGRVSKVHYLKVAARDGTSTRPVRQVPYTSMEVAIIPMKDKSQGGDDIIHF